MNREIKFRAWDKVSKQMFKVYSIEFREDGIWACLDWMSKVTGLRENWLSPDRLELMQFTGLHDKNGKEIFEKDVVKYPGYKPFVIEWKNDIVGDGNCHGYQIRKDELEVIGNIYENQELIKTL